VGPFALEWVRSTRFGALAAVSLPTGKEPVPAEVLAQLDPAEAAFATSESGRRQIEIVGGRLAARAAAKHLGVAWPALLSGNEREPQCPPGVSASLTHKTDLAIALVARSSDGTVGIDLEGDERERVTIASRVCRPEELEEIEALPENQRWLKILVRFAVKEAVYKAVFPHVRHYFGFQAARVDATSGAVTMFLPPEDPRVEIESELEWLTPKRVLAMVRARLAAHA